MSYYVYLLAALVPLGAIGLVAGAIQGSGGGVLGGLLAIAVGTAGYFLGRDRD